jgi:hypothetical protein
MDKIWILEERKLWDAMHAWPRLTADSRKGAKLIAEAKRSGRKPPKLPTDAEALAKSWSKYKSWIAH